MKRLLLGSVLSASIKVASAGLTFLMFMFLARVLGPEEYGYFGTMFAAGTVAAMVVQFGQHTLGMKVVSGIADDPSKATERRSFVIGNYKVVGTASIIAIAVAAGLAGINAGLRLGYDPKYLIGACIMMIPFALSEVVAHHYRALGSIGWALLPRDVIWRGLVVVGCATTGFAAWVFSDALQSMFVISAVLMGLTAVQITVLFKVFPHMTVPKDVLQASETQVTNANWNVSIWMWIASLGMMGGNINVVVASAFLPAAEIGSYFAAQKTSQLLQLPIMAINIVAGPIFARLFSQNKIGELRDAARKMAMLLIIPLVLSTLIIMIYGEQLLSLFDPAFAEAAVALTALALGQLIIGLGGPTRQLMLMADGERKVVHFTLMSECIGLALIPIAVPLFGIIGAAIAILVTRVLFTGLTVLWCRSQLGVDTSVLSIVARMSPK